MGKSCTHSTFSCGKGWLLLSILRKGPVQCGADATHGCSGPLQVLPLSSDVPLAVITKVGLSMPTPEYHSAPPGGGVTVPLGVV
jgi:hypothetical protein